MQDASEATPPASPSAVRRARDDDVFLRLTGAATDHAQGTVKEITAKRASVGGGGGGGGGAGAWLQCTHVAEGHVGAALSLAATADLLYSGGVDRTVRGWDVSAGREAWRAWGGAAVGALAAGAGTAHDSRLVLAAAGPAVKLFDTRTNGPHAVLWSSGASGANAGVKGGETAITALALAPPHRLYTAAADKLRLWDLRMLECLYKTWSGHAAAVMCMAREALDSGDRLATGSRDHCVRVIDLHHASGGCEVQGRRQLEPPHYDGVQALLLRGAALYSASRDSSLKCWSLDDNSLAHSVMNAHKGWVTGVVGVGGVVVSCGRDAALRAWTPALRPAAPPAPAPDPPAALAAAPPHAPPAVYTAGSGGEVRVWRVYAP